MTLPRRMNRQSTYTPAVCTGMRAVRYPMMLSREWEQPPTTTKLLERAGDALPLWGAITAFLVDSYRTQTIVQWESWADAWGQTYQKGSRAVAHIVPYDGYLLVFIPFNASAMHRATASPSLLDPNAQATLDCYVNGATPIPTVRVCSDVDVDVVMRLVSLAHPRKNHPCGSL